MTRLLALVWPSLRAEDAELQLFDAMLDRLDDLSPRIEAVDRGVALVDITGLGPLLGDERRIAARAVALTRGVAQLPVRAGVGDNRWLAVLAARLARPQRQESEAAFRTLGVGELAVLPLDLLPADPVTRSRFALFGLTAMGQLATLPRSAVGAQFGEPGERLQQLARGHDPRPLIPRKRPERHTAHATFEPPAEGITEIALALRRLTGELCDALRARHLAPGRASLSLRLEDAPKLSVELAFPEPALEPDWIARLLIGRLEQATRARQRNGRRATHHRHRPCLRPAGGPGGQAASRLRGTRGPLGGAALVAGTGDDALRGGPPVAGQPRPPERVARPNIGPAW